MNQINQSVCFMAKLKEERRICKPRPRTPEVISGERGTISCRGKRRTSEHRAKGNRGSEEGGGGSKEDNSINGQRLEGGSRRENGLVLGEESNLRRSERRETEGRGFCEKRSSCGE